MIAISKILVSQSNEIIQIIAKFIITFNLQCYYISNITSRINNFLHQKLLFFKNCCVLKMIAISKLLVSQSNEIIQIIVKFIITFNLQCYYISNTTSRINNLLHQKLLFFKNCCILKMIAISKIPVSQSNEIIQIIAKFIITLNLQCYYISNTTSRINNFLHQKLLCSKNDCYLETPRMPK